MFGRLKRLFKKAEDEVGEKLEKKAEEGPASQKAPAEEASPVEKSGKEATAAAGKVLKEEAEGVGEAGKAREGKAEKPAEKGRAGKEIKVGLKTRLKTAMRRKTRLGEPEIEEITWGLQMGLMQSDVAMEVAEAIGSQLKEKLASAEFTNPREQVREIFKDTLVGILKAGGELDFMEFVKGRERPVKIVFFGINGCGKTTTIAKLAKMLKGSGLSVVAAAADTFRAGAEEQLGEHAKRVGIRMVHHQRGGDAAAVVFDAVKHAEANGIDVVLADTSGRMQSDTDLMGEMEKIARVNKPDLRVFVGDALTGNDAVEQAKVFNERIGIDASILAKVDASKGGAALSVSYVTGKPIIFLGVGQGYEDLKEFDPEGFVEEII